MVRASIKTALLSLFLLHISLAANAAQLVTNGGFESFGAGWMTDPAFAPPNPNPVGQPLPGPLQAIPRVDFTPIVDYYACCSPLTGTYAYGNVAAFFGAGEAPG